MRTRLPASLGAAALVAGLLAVPSTTAVADPTVVASTLGDDADLNLLTADADAVGYSKPADGFGTYQRGVSTTIPFALLDDSAGSFTPDTQGVIDTGETFPFVGATDTVNGDAFADRQVASFTFDVSGADGPLFVNVRAGAMGDFEASSDSFEFTATVGGAAAGSLAATVDEAASRTYTLESGTVVSLPDPLNLGGVELDDDLRDVSFPVTATGDELVVEFAAETNGGGEAFVFTDLVITADEPLVGGDGGGTDPEPEPVCTVPDEDLTLISEVQGPGFTSPFVGETVTIKGVVTQTDAAGGFFLQEEPGDHDEDPLTSEGIFVFRPFDFPEVGATLQLTDRVDERFGLTQMAVPDLEVCDGDPVTIEPSLLTLPLDDTGREALEGMLVSTTQQLDVTGLFAPFAYGELGLTSLDGPLTQPTSQFAPDDAQAQVLFDLQAASFIKIDDRGEFGSSRDPWAQPVGGVGPRPGDTVAAGITGGMTFTFGEYKIQPRGEFPEVVAEGEFPRPDAPELGDGNDVAAFNVLNFFNTFGDSSVLRGATNGPDFEVQTAKIVDAINRLDAAVLGLIEIENDYEDLFDGDATTEASIVTLVNALNEAADEDKWAYVAPEQDQLTSEGLGNGGLGTDAIAVGIIYQPDRATEVGTPATFDIDAELYGDRPDKNRWPFAQTFEVDGEVVTVVVNHLKSKGSSCARIGGPDFAIGEDDGSDLTGSCTLTREYAAQRLLDWIDTKPTGTSTPDTLVVGDLNSYEEEGPIRVFEEAGYLDLVERYGDDAFTYKFDGRYGRLDYALASPSAKRLVTDAAVWQANSPEFYGNLYDGDPIDETAYASSDHDPVVVSLDGPGRSDVAVPSADHGRPDNAGPPAGRGPGGRNVR